MNSYLNNFLPPGTIIETKNGGNSTVHKYLLRSGEEFAVKIYGNHVSDQDKLREAWVYHNWIDKKQICNFISMSADNSILVTEWYGGRSGNTNTVKLDAIISFIESGIDLHKKIGESSFFFAKDVIRRREDLIIQIDSRVSLLEKHIDANSEIAYLLKYIRKLNFEFLVYRRDIEVLGDELLPSQSDIGFHNVLMGPNEFKIIDFEYFGLDNPYKLVGDFLLHPRNVINVASLDTFLEYSKKSLKIQEHVLHSLIPLLALKWGVIVIKRALMNDEPGFQHFTDLAWSYVQLAKKVYYADSWEQEILTFSGGKYSD